MAKQRINFFVSYAQYDAKSCVALLRELQVQMNASALYKFSLWDDRAIIAGELWKSEILTAIDESDLGLLLVSPAFLGSEFIAREELPHFTGNEGKPCIPAEAQQVLQGTHDLKGLEERQVFRFDRKKAFADCQGQEKTRFVQQLYQQIERRLQRLS